MSKASLVHMLGLHSVQRHAHHGRPRVPADVSTVLVLAPVLRGLALLVKTGCLDCTRRSQRRLTVRDL